MALVKCQLCLSKEDKSLMIKESKGYYHEKGCHAAYLQDKEFKRIERGKKDKLAEKIAEVYELDSIQLIPSQFYPYLEDLRNDSKLFGKLGKSYKNGIPYEGISYTYEYCKEKIREVHRTKEFKNFQMELRYGLAIIKNNLIDARDHAIQQKRIKELSNIEKEKQLYAPESNTIIYKSKESKNNITDYL